jgi:hypothetical protein
LPRHSQDAEGFIAKWLNPHAAAMKLKPGFDNNLGIGDIESVLAIVLPDALRKYVYDPDANRENITLAQMAHDFRIVGAFIRDECQRHSLPMIYMPIMRVWLRSLVRLHGNAVAYLATRPSLGAAAALQAVGAFYTTSKASPGKTLAALLMSSGNTPLCDLPVAAIVVPDHSSRVPLQHFLLNLPTDAASGFADTTLSVSALLQRIECHAPSPSNKGGQHGAAPPTDPDSDTDDDMPPLRESDNDNSDSSEAPPAHCQTPPIMLPLLAPPPIRCCSPIVTLTTAACHPLTLPPAACPPSTPCPTSAMPKSSSPSVEAVTSFLDASHDPAVDLAALPRPGRDIGVSAARNAKDQRVLAALLATEVPYDSALVVDADGTLLNGQVHNKSGFARSADERTSVGRVDMGIAICVLRRMLLNNAFAVISTGRDFFQGAPEAFASVLLPQLIAIAESKEVLGRPLTQPEATRLAEFAHPMMNHRLPGDSVYVAKCHAADIILTGRPGTAVMFLDDDANMGHTLARQQRAAPVPEGDPHVCLQRVKCAKAIATATAPCVTVFSGRSAGGKTTLLQGAMASWVAQEGKDKHALISGDRETQEAWAKSVGGEPKDPAQNKADREAGHQRAMALLRVALQNPDIKMIFLDYVDGIATLREGLGPLANCVRVINIHVTVPRLLGADLVTQQRMHDGVGQLAIALYLRDADESGRRSTTVRLNQALGAKIREVHSECLSAFPQTLAALVVARIGRVRAAEESLRIAVATDPCGAAPTHNEADGASDGKATDYARGRQALADAERRREAPAVLLAALLSAGIAAATAQELLDAALLESTISHADMGKPPRSTLLQKVAGLVTVASIREGAEGAVLLFDGVASAVARWLKVTTSASRTDMADVVAFYDANPGAVATAKFINGQADAMTDRACAAAMLNTGVPLRFLDLRAAARTGGNKEFVRYDMGKVRPSDAYTDIVVRTTLAGKEVLGKPDPAVPLGRLLSTEEANGTSTSGSNVLMHFNPSLPGEFAEQLSVFGPVYKGLIARERMGEAPLGGDAPAHPLAGGAALPGHRGQPYLQVEFAAPTGDPLCGKHATLGFFGPKTVLPAWAWDVVERLFIETPTTVTASNTHRLVEHTAVGGQRVVVARRRVWLLLQYLSHDRASVQTDLQWETATVRDALAILRQQQGMVESHPAVCGLAAVAASQPDMLLAALLNFSEQMHVTTQPMAASRGAVPLVVPFFETKEDSSTGVQCPLFAPVMKKDKEGNLVPVLHADGTPKTAPVTANTKRGPALSCLLDGHALEQWLNIAAQVHAMLLEDESKTEAAATAAKTARLISKCSDIVLAQRSLPKVQREQAAAEASSARMQQSTSQLPFEVLAFERGEERYTGEAKNEVEALKALKNLTKKNADAVRRGGAATARLPALLADAAAMLDLEAKTAAVAKTTDTISDIQQKLDLADLTPPNRVKLDAKANAVPTTAGEHLVSLEPQRAILTVLSGIAPTAQQGAAQQGKGAAQQGKGAAQQGKGAAQQGKAPAASPATVLGNLIARIAAMSVEVEAIEKPDTVHATCHLALARSNHRKA